MGVLYIIIGGVVTLFWSLSSFDTLTTDKVFQVYTIGIGWQGLVTGLITASDAKEGKDAPELRRWIQDLRKKVDELSEEKIKELSGDNK